MTAIETETRDRIAPSIRRIGAAGTVTLLALTAGCSTQPGIDSPHYFKADSVGECARGQTMVCEAVSLSMLEDPSFGACQCLTLEKYTRPMSRRPLNRRR
jgi:hypothetical protein